MTPANAPAGMLPTTLSARDIAGSVLAIESRLDLQLPDWTEADVHWWPLYRTELYRLLFSRGACSSGAQARRALRPIVQPVRLEFEPTPPGAVWLVSDGISYAALGQRDVERFCAPLWTWCRNEGVPALIVDRARARAPRAQEPTRWLAPWTLRAKARSMARARVTVDDRHRALVAHVDRAAAAGGMPATGLTARRMQALSNAVKDLADQVEACLRRERVRALIAVSWYDVAGYAYVLAASRAGVPSVDVQHGVTGNHNVAYASWPPCATGWRLLPQWFWSWTESDRDLVQRWASSTPHRAVCGGHPFLEAWRDGVFHLDPVQRDTLTSLMVRTEGRRPVLVTLQPQLTHETALQPLLEAMRRATPSFFWWLRLHPTSAGDGPALLRLLSSHGLVDHELDASTALPLPELLTRCRIHATHSSSTFIEAAALGVPSIVWSQYGAELAEDALRDGTAFHAVDGASFASLLRVCAEAQPPRAASSPGRGPAALRRILEAAP